ncbi:MAG: LTA synthase family protein, partial [Rhodanobacteraceae bacterium]
MSPAVLFGAPWPLWINALPGLLLAAALLALTRRALLSFLIAFGIEALLYRVNELKEINLASPLVPADFRMLGQLHRGGAHLLGGYAHVGMGLIFAAIAAVVLLIALSWRYEPPVLRGKSWPRAGLALCAFAALLSLCAGWPAWRVVYNRNALGFEPWSAQHTAQRAGLIGMLALYRLDYADQSMRIDARAARTLLAGTAPAVRARMIEGGGERPDIVIVQSESFFDPGRMRGYAPYQSIPNFARLASQGESGPLHVPTFGGGTIRTEFEVLTGLPLRYFPQVQFPYLQIDAKKIPGLARVLAARGYATLAIHDNDAGFWNRASALKHLGFQRFIAIGGFPKDSPLDGRYVSDRALTDEI